MEMPMNDSSSNLIRSIRKKRLTKKEIKDFALWALKEDAFNKYTSGRIKQIYKEISGVELTDITVKNQKNRWVLIDDKVYEVNKPWTMPNNLSSNGTNNVRASAQDQRSVHNEDTNASK